MKPLIYKQIEVLKKHLKNTEIDAAKLQAQALIGQGISDTATGLIKALCKHHGQPLETLLKHSVAPEVAIDYSKIDKLSKLDELPPKQGISIVSCCMNRNENLKKALKTWLKLSVDEIIIVDWSSSTPVSETLAGINDSRVKIIRVENESKWILTYGFNVGLRAASFEKIYKLDADIEVSPNFLELNSFIDFEYVRGHWKTALDNDQADQTYVNGSFGCYKKHLLEIGFYNEYIRSYGWDDSDIYSRLSNECGLKRKYLSFDSVVHMTQEQEERLAHQNVSKNKFLGHFESTEYYNMRNKYQTSLYGDWSCKLLSDYEITDVKNNVVSCRRISEDLPIPKQVITDAERYAVIKLTSWFDPELTNVLYLYPEMPFLVKEHFYQGVPFSYTKEIVNNITLNIPAEKGEVLTGNIHDLLMKMQPQPQFEYIRANSLPTSLELECDNVKLWLVTANTDNQEGSANLEGTESRVFITSLFDESKPERLREYLYCIQENCKHFDTLFLFYEKSSGLLYQELKKLLGNTVYWQKIIFCTYQERPTFKFLFDIADKLFPNAIICISNADIAVDESIKKITLDKLDDSFFAISRHEVDINSKKSTGLILNQLGIPNTFSADMWVYSSPRKYKFKSDFPIGTFHCDSFMNYYIDKSGYKLFNPCLDINLYHIHDPVFNSSEEKAIKQKEEIEKKLQEEVNFNNGVYPLKGSKWGMIESYNLETSCTGVVDWFNTLIKIEIHNGNVVQGLAAALIALESFESINCPTSVWLNLQHPINDANTYKLVESFVQFIDSPYLHFGVYHSESKIAKSDELVQLDVSHAQLIETVESLRNRECSDFWGFVNKNYEFNGKFGLDYDPFISALFQVDASDIHTYKLINALQTHQLGYLEAFITQMAPGNSMVAFKSDIECMLKKTSQAATKNNNKIPTISFITSVYKGEEFMRGYLENIAIAALECGGEVIIIDANSPEQEIDVFNQFISDFPEYEVLFTYEKLDHDPGLYNCWELAINKSSAEYVSNANLDDRRSPFQAGVLIEQLNNNPKYSGAASAMRATTARNTPWYKQTENQYWFNKGYRKHIDFDALYIKSEDNIVKSQNIMHCMPIWKKSLHKTYGYFNEEKYGTSADWAFWLECTQNGEVFCLVPQVLSQYYINEQSHNRVNDPNGTKEKRIIADYLNVNQTVFEQQ
ncbi:glycosyltransferase family 2 protein [Shewanella youngdeokensis]|uniref:Glycosyltransferase family 2 protein n=1 Tax=Shewanella youngdeokensis TaxID=2999068 RepID=A0ABZ0K3F8_9GAMM|nr:glycosyltransferase family 2 protein [Shewanella sp. DAU334]